MTHNERMRLINLPLNIAVHLHTYPWGGALISESVEEKVRRGGRLAVVQAGNANEDMSDDDLVDEMIEGLDSVVEIEVEDDDFDEREPLIDFDEEG